MLNKKVTILMPVYNGQAYVYDAVTSMLNQTYHDFDLLVIDDGSTDKSLEILQAFDDERLVIEQNPQNMGIVQTLNKGLEMITGEYVIRMDADDIAKPARLEKQVTFMDSRPDVGASSGAAIVFKEEKAISRLRMPVGTRETRTELLFKSPLIHPATIIRNETIKKNGIRYRAELKATEDFGFWQDISFVSNIDNLSTNLIRYRDNEHGISNISRKNSEARDRAHYAIYSTHFSRLGIDLDDAALGLWRDWNTGNMNLNDLKQVEEAGKLFAELKSRLNEKDYHLAYFDKRMSVRFRMCAQTQKLSLNEMLTLHKNYFSNSFSMQPLEIAKYSVLKIIK